MTGPPKFVTAADHPGVDPWATMERAAGAGLAVMLPAAVVARMLADHAAVVEKANGVVRSQWVAAAGHADEGER